MESEATLRSAESTHRGALNAILLGGFVAGMLDGFDAVVFYRWYAGVSPVRLFQHIASGVVGARAFDGGWAAVILGIALHFTIATGAAAVYWSVATRSALMMQRPVVSGIAFGICVYLVMHFAVVPLSTAFPKRSLAMPPLELADQLLSHCLFVGVSIAWIARRAARASLYA